MMEQNNKRSILYHLHCIHEPVKDILVITYVADDSALVEYNDEFINMLRCYYNSEGYDLEIHPVE